ncbi:ABC transporter substrate-binding protein [Phytohabitans aurantiacus]|uniref:Sugar ABC transporter substrate-binding protein n=1 Tax=Phytohabitans aurantiacus TaxID=3016789 RepID=A0ABQ5QWJ3_9ACTN|nr:extracellular solute-binding protein [Phytohabitans aurantiacus]GLH98883.1 sugar ABC transporter substrate-binding protein [Phytohabitans aurantiacus]
MTSRRGLLRVAAGGAAAALAGCGKSGGALEVAVVWSGGELARFREVVRGYPEPVRVISAGDNIDALLRARDRAGARPDVAILPRPGLVAGYARDGWLEPLDTALGERYAPAWTDLITVDGVLYGVWVKAAHKSLFWHLPSVLTDQPDSWSGLLAMVESRAADGGPAPLAIGAADGWVLTDWLENLLASFDDQRLYQDLAAGKPLWDAWQVRDALAALARMWSVPGAFPGGGRRALLTQNEESVIQVVASRDACTVFEGDFVAGVARQFQDEAPRTFRFPAFAGRQPLVVGGDAAVVLRGSAGGRDLVRWLAGPDAFRPWIAGGGYLSPNRLVPLGLYPAGQPRELAAEVREPVDGLRFDLSDQLPGSFTGFDGQGVWKILQDFFAAVTTPSADLRRAVDDTVAQLNATAKKATA